MKLAPRGSALRAIAEHAHIGLLELWLAACRAALGAHSATSQALAALGFVHERHGELEPARRELEGALAMLDALAGDHDGQRLAILNRLGRIDLRLGRPKDALACAESALALAEQMFGSKGIELAHPLAVLAEACFALGLLDTCYDAVERAHILARAAFGDDDPQTAKAEVRFGVVLTEVGNHAQAITLHEHALAVMRACRRDEWVAAILASLAAAHVSKGNGTAARPLYAEALAIARAHFGARDATTGAYLAAFAGYLDRSDEATAALVMYDEAIALMGAALGETHPDVAATLLERGRLRCGAEPVAGRADVMRALAILGAQQHRPRLFAHGYLVLARLLEPSAAAILLRKLAVNEIEDMRTHVARLDPLLERTFLRQNADEFRALSDALIRAGRLPEAQQVLAMLKEHELYGLTRLDAHRSEATLTELEARWVERGEALFAEFATSLTASPTRAIVDTAAARLTVWLDDLVADFATAGTDAAGVSTRAAAAPVPATRPPPAGTALLQYLLAPDCRGLNIILTIGDVQREYRIALAEGELNQLVFALRGAVENRAEGVLASAGRLYDILIAPLVPELAAHGIDTLALSLDGVLRYLPIAALHDGTQYLIERFALLLTTGAVTKSPVNAAQATTRRAVGLGVSRPLAGHRALPGVREELAAVIRTDGAAQGVLPGVIRLDEAFTAAELERATQAASPVIHVASHFVFEAAREAASYLVLGDGARLTLPELAQLRFAGVELVVLSACNTAVGGGHRQSGREIEGLGAMVRHQGGRRVLATLWRVADLTTAAVMRDFYRNQFEVMLAPAQSLRQAQLALLRNSSPAPALAETRGLVDPDAETDRGVEAPATAHPFFWAPYILLGEIDL